MIRYLLDTNICIELIRSRSAVVLDRLRQCQIGEVGISSITLAELEYGVAHSSDPNRNRIALAQFVAPLDVLPFDGDAAVVYGQVREQLAAEGTPIGALDTLIAAHAKSLSATLVTHNTREFNRVRGVRVEDWIDA